MAKQQEPPKASAEAKGTRTKANCPICHATVALGSLYHHITIGCQKRGGKAP